MNHDERIKALEAQLESEETRIKGLIMSGKKILTPDDYAETDRIKKELKAARRVRTMDAKRVEPKLTRGYNLTFSENEYQELVAEADQRGMKLSSYIRELIKIGREVERS